MIYIFDDRALEGPVVDMNLKLKDWLESKVGYQLPEWPGKPPGWEAPWPNFNTPEVKIHYAKRTVWRQKAALFPIEMFIEELLRQGYKEHELYKDSLP